MASIFENISNGGPVSGSLRTAKAAPTAEFSPEVEETKVNQPKVAADSKCTHLQEGGLLGSKIKLCESSYQGHAEVSSASSQCRSDVPLPRFFACLFSESAEQVIASVRKLLSTEKEQVAQSAPPAPTAVAKEEKAAEQVCYQTGDTGAGGLKTRVCEEMDAAPREVTVEGYRKNSGHLQETSPKEKADFSIKVYSKSIM